MPSLKQDLCGARTPPTKNLLDSFLAGVASKGIGYAFAYGPSNSISYDLFTSARMPDTDSATFLFSIYSPVPLPPSCTDLHTVRAIVSGAMAMRCEFLAYFVYSFIIYRLHLLSLAIRVAGPKQWIFGATRGVNESWTRPTFTVG